VYGFEILGFGKYLTERKRPALVFDLRIVTSVSSDTLHRTKEERIAVIGLYTYFPTHIIAIVTICNSIVFLHPISKSMLQTHIFIRAILERIDESRELLLGDIREVIVLYHVNTAIEELQTNTERRESKIRRLDEDNN